MRELEKNIINLYGEQGKQWLTNLYALTEQTWSLSHVTIDHILFSVMIGLCYNRPPKRST